MEINIKQKIYDDIEKYCLVNNLDIEREINKYITIGFNCERFGTTPFSPKEEVKEIEKPIEGRPQLIVTKTEVKPKKKITIIQND